MTLTLSPRAKLYAKRFGITGAIIGFLPIGLRAVMLISDYVVDHSDTSSFGEVGFFAIPMLLFALFYAAAGAAIGAVFGVGVALIFDRRPTSEAVTPLGFDGTLPPRVRKWRFGPRSFSQRWRFLPERIK